MDTETFANQQRLSAAAQRLLERGQVASGRMPELVVFFAPHGGNWQNQRLIRCPHHTLLDESELRDAWYGDDLPADVEDWGPPPQVQDAFFGLASAAIEQRRDIATVLLWTDYTLVQSFAQTMPRAGYRVHLEYVPFDDPDDLPSLRYPSLIQADQHGTSYDHRRLLCLAAERYWEKVNHMDNDHPSWIGPRMYDALLLAVRLHGHLARKGSSSVMPVMTHLLAVCRLVIESGGSEDDSVAALLHDSLEDAPDQISSADIRQRFGDPVLRIVECCTDTPPDYAGGPKPPWRQRKEAYLAHARAADPRLLRVTVADKVDNLSSLLTEYGRSHAHMWDRFHAGRDDQMWYYGACLQAYEAAGFKGPLLDRMRWLLSELDRVTKTG